MTDYFISDTHFGHRYASKLRGFETPEDHDAQLILEWNQQVTDNDHVYLLGDVTFRGMGYSKGIFDQLKGYIMVVPGNHDRNVRVLERLLEGRGKMLPPIHRCLQVGIEKKITLCHFPLAAWDGSDRGSINFHGHLHGTNHHMCDKYTGAGLRFDVGVEVLRRTFGTMAPATAQQIIAKVDQT